MSVGKIASQAGHAFVEAFVASQQSTLAGEYRADGMGTKVCLSAKSLDQLLEAHAALQEARIPCALITDSGCPDFFEGRPTVTALGFGPAHRKQVERITRKFRLL